jgi:hypothetical protein
VEAGGSLDGRKIASPTMSKRKKERRRRISRDTSSGVTDIPRGRWIVQYSVVQNNTVQYSTVQCIRVTDNAVRYGTVQYQH